MTHLRVLAPLLLTFQASGGLLVGCGDAKVDPARADLGDDAAHAIEGSVSADAPAVDGAPDARILAGEKRVVYIKSPANESIAVRLILPTKPRFDVGAPLVVSVSPFLGQVDGYNENEVDSTEIGAIRVSYLWPGQSATGPEDKSKSEGTYDYAGKAGISALAEVIRFALGKAKTVEGLYIHELTAVTPLVDNVGLYAFSHPGMAVALVLSEHGESLAGLKYFVGGENPTTTALLTFEAGYFDATGAPRLNASYRYPADYTKESLALDYKNVKWLVNPTYPNGRPVFHVDGVNDYVVDYAKTVSFGKKRFYSSALHTALVDNAQLSPTSWPTDLATPAEAKAIMPYYDSPPRYAAIARSLPSLKVMLAFGKKDHAQPAKDKPHVHMAYDGFRGGSIWTKLNPASCYVVAQNSKWNRDDFPDTLANTSPADWTTVESLGWPNIKGANPVVPLAAMAEMADRVQMNNWSDRVANVLWKYP